jgi:hypothetical protein
LLLLVLVLVTATVSGVFGMAGGLMLMGGLTLAMPVSAAMVTHGAVQFVSNGWRAMLHRAHIDWRIIVMYGVGSAIAAGLLASVTYEPTKAWVYLMLGLVPGLAWLPKGKFHLDAAKAHTRRRLRPFGHRPQRHRRRLRPAARRLLRAHKSPAPRHRRHQSRDASVQPHRENGVLRRAAHHRRQYRPAAMVVLPRRRAARDDRRWLGGMVLDRMSDVNFLKYTRWIVTARCTAVLCTARSLFATSWIPDRAPALKLSYGLVRDNDARSNIPALSRAAPSSTSSKSAGLHSSASQIFASVSNRTPFTLPLRSSERFASVMPTRSAKSFDFILRRASITSRVTTIRIKRSDRSQL